jgi:hypothetical protein
LPGFLFSNPIFAGFFAMIMCAMFGIVGALFLGGWSPHAVEVYDAARTGAAFTLIIGAGALILAAIGALRSEDRNARLHFVFGAAATIVLLVVADRTALQSVRDWLEPMNSFLGAEPYVPKSL